MNKKEVMKYLDGLTILEKFNLGSNDRSPIFYCINSDGSTVIARALTLNQVLRFLQSRVSDGRKYKYEKDSSITGMLAWIYRDGVNTIRIIRCCDEYTKSLFKMIK